MKKNWKGNKRREKIGAKEVNEKGGLRGKRRRGENKISRVKRCEYREKEEERYEEEKKEEYLFA